MTLEQKKKPTDRLLRRVCDLRDLVAMAPTTVLVAAVLALAPPTTLASIGDVEPHGGGHGGHCVWYGVCGQDPDASGSHRLLNCRYDGPAKEASDEDAAVLRETCPHLADELERRGGPVSLCCDSRQLSDLKRAFALPESLMGRCPACLANFRKNFCDLTCRPDQSRFVNVTKAVRGPSFSGEFLPLNRFSTL